MRKILLIFILFTGLSLYGNVEQVFAKETVCEAGDDYCASIDERCYCNSDYDGYNCYTCSNYCVATTGLCSVQTTCDDTCYNCNNETLCSGWSHCKWVYYNTQLACVPKTCADYLHVCKTNDMCLLYGGTSVGTYDCGSGICCDEDGNISAVKCNTTMGCSSCQTCINPGTINSSCLSYTNSGTNGVCGGSDGQTVCSYDLSATCTSGNPTTPTLSGSTYSWRCDGIPAATCPASVSYDDCTATKKTPVAGAAGDCNDTAISTSYCDYASIPTKCDTGGATLVNDNFTNGIDWTCAGTTTGEVCSGGAGATVSCSTTKKTPVAGAAGDCNDTAISTSYCDYASIPTKCDVGNPTLVKDNLTDGIQWTCSGTTTGEVCGGGAGATVSCSTTKKTPVTRVDGVCSGINGTVVQARPGESELCNPGNPSPVPVNTSGTTYSWACYGTDGVCPANTAIDRSCSAIQDTRPVSTIIPAPVPPGLTDPTPNPSGGIRLNNCQNSNPNIIPTIKFSVSDANGISDVAGVYMRFKGTTLEYGPVMPTVDGLVTFTNLDISTLPDGIYTIEAKAVDVHAADIGSAWVDLAFEFKKWDCQVDVDGTIYDNSAGSSCVTGSSTGFSTPIPSNIEPFTFAYGDLTAGTTRNMTVTAPNFYSPDTLTWQNTHFLDNFDVDDTNFLGVFQGLKINDVCIVPHNIHIIPRNYVNAYDANPTIDIKYSAIMDQEAWFRVNGGGVFTSSTNTTHRVTNYIPVTCTTNCVTSLGGLVWSRDVTLSDWDESITSEVNVLRPLSYSFEKLKYDIYGGKEVGTTITDTVTRWSEIKGDPTTNKGELFISGDLVIDEDVIPGISNYVLFVVGGNISVSESVARIDAMMFANGAITISGKNDTKLTINGSLYGKTGVTLDRSYLTKRKNNTVPAIEITYDANSIFKLNPKLWYTYDNWTIE